MKNPNPFYFNALTPDKVKYEIETLYQNKHRVHLFLGDKDTGTVWLEEYDVCGTVGKSTGTKPCALLINNARSYGGPAILTHCIVKMIDIDTRRVLYEHPTFNNPADRAERVPLSDPNLPSYVAEVKIDGEVHARFKSAKSADNWLAFMQGKRFSK